MHELFNPHNSGSVVKNLPANAGDAMQETQFQSLGWKDPLEKEMATHSSILVWERGERSPVGYNPCGHKESDII